jgi:hypothetical protein
LTVHFAELVTEYGLQGYAEETPCWNGVSISSHLHDALEFVDDVVKSSNKIADGPATDDVLK